MATRRAGLGIQSKLLIMLLGVSVLSTVVIGAIGFVSGRQSLENAAIQQVTSLRETKAREIERTLASIQAGAVLDSRNATTVAASLAFNEGFQDLQTTELDGAQSAALDAFYADVFVPALEKRTQTESAPGVFTPTSPAQRYLQSFYTVPFAGDFTASIGSDDAGDGSTWSAAHARYQDGFRVVVESLGYEDLLLLDTEGNVVYSAYAGVDLGTNVLTGPFSGGALAGAYEQTLASNSIDSFTQTDFERYQPSNGVPTSWITSPIGENGEISGVLAVQLPIDRINRVTTGNESWESDGLGQTGEVYVVGPDKTMRSASRLLLQHPDTFVERVIAGGTPPDIAERQAFVKGNVLLQPVTMASVDDALKGDAVERIDMSYDGREAVVAAAPLTIEGLRWVIVAEVDSSEAFAPVNEFTRNLLISAAALILVVSLLSLVLAQVFTRPIRRLGVAVDRVAAGDLGIEVDATSRDEFGDLGTAFNGMSRSLQLKADLLEEQLAENEKLLLTLMPSTVAKRYRGGEETIAEDHKDVAVLFADIIGFDDYTASRASDAGLADLNTIVRGFDEAAERLGIERVRTLRNGYLASSGLVIPRVDNARRALDFAVEMASVVERFNQTTGAGLSLRAGVDAGAVTSGLVGRSSLAYDLWGDAVNIAHRVQGASEQPGIFVSQRVYDLLRDSYTFSAAAEGAAEPVWKLGAPRG